MTSRQPDAKFRRDAINVMTGSAEVVSMRLGKTEQTVSRAADAIEQQTVNISNFTANVDRLERVITLVVAENSAQRETVHNLIKLATALVNQRAS